MATLIPFSAGVFAKNQGNEKAEKFIEMAQKAQQKVEELMEMVDETRDIADLYEAGESKLAEAEAEQDTEKAREATIIFREAYKQLYTLLEGEEAEAEVETEEEGEEEAEEEEEAEVETEEEEGAEEEEEAAGEPEDPETLMEAIQRARERIGRVEDIMDANDDYLTRAARGVLNGLLDAAGDRLDDAVEDLDKDPPRVSTAAKNLGNARKLISQAFVTMKKAAKASNRGRMKSYLIVINNFYDKMARWVERAGLTEDFESELEDIEDLIDDAHTMDLETEFDDIVSNLMEARIRLESIKREVLEQRKGGPKA